VTAPTAEIARQWLERQLAELNDLRNASNRAPEFKTWRQNTLTVIQRIWPGDAQRSDRFRRIPFRTPGSKVGDRAVREAYEHGCGEAGVLLRQLVGELTLVGLEDSPEPPASSAPTAPSAAPAAPSAPAFNPVTEWLDRLPAPRPHVPRREQAGAPASPTPSPSAQHHNVRPSRPAVPPPPLPPRSVEAPPVATPPRAQEPRVRHVESEEVTRVTSAFLSASPIFAPRETAAPLPEFATEPAQELAAMALALDTLRVPPARRRALGIALLELARALEEGDPDWGQLRDGVHFVMEYPTVARRALPHLLPFIQKAA
jgi:hypothetical protein